jgi:tRNA A37 threonylcarbamoyladenosine dehydratase
MDYSRRFGGITRLYGSRAVECFKTAHVAVIGIGGVGSWAVEALARSGIGYLTLYDLDHVTESNVNRQLPALESEFGKAKVSVLSQRVEQINPDCQITAIESFIEAENIAELSAQDFNYIIDCIDNYRNKAAIIAHCKRNRLPVITIGGAGGRIDPTKIRLSDLSRSEQDPLLSKTRKLLRKEYGFSNNLKRRFDVQCVYSMEQQRYPDGEGEICQDLPHGLSGKLNCGGYGSAMTVTASFGLVAVSHVLKQLAAKSRE